MKRAAIALLGVSALAIASTCYARYGDIDVSRLHEVLPAVDEWYQRRPVASLFVFILSYIVIAALAIPLAAITTVSAGAVFGFWLGLLVVSFSSTIGATLAFSAARYLLRDWAEARLLRKAKHIEAGLDQDGPLYLASLRLMPVVPFFVVNIAMGMTTIRTSTFFLVSQAAMLPSSIVYVSAGTQLASVHSLSDIVSPPLLLTFALLALFPWIARYCVLRFVRYR